MNTILAIIIGFIIGFLVATSWFTYLGYKNWNSNTKKVEEIFQGLNEIESNNNNTIKEKGEEE